MGWSWRKQQSWTRTQAILFSCGFDHSAYCLMCRPACAWPSFSLILLHQPRTISVPQLLCAITSQLTEGFFSLTRALCHQCGLSCPRDPLGLAAVHTSSYPEPHGLVVSFRKSVTACFCLYFMKYSVPGEDTQYWKEWENGKSSLFVTITTTNNLFCFCKSWDDTALTVLVGNKLF